MIDAFASPIPDTDPYQDSHDLAFRPLWPGFAINTIFYAVILWLLIAAPFKLRRFIRTKRHRCPGCGYPIGTSPVCTECGKPVTTAVPGRINVVE